MSDRIKVEYSALPIGAVCFRTADSEGAHIKSAIGHVCARRGMTVWIEPPEVAFATLGRGNIQAYPTSAEVKDSQAEGRGLRHLPRGNDGDS